MWNFWTIWQQILMPQCDNMLQIIYWKYILGPCIFQSAIPREEHWDIFPGRDSLQRKIIQAQWCSLHTAHHSKVRGIVRGRGRIMRARSKHERSAHHETYLRQIRTSPASDANPLWYCHRRRHPKWYRQEVTVTIHVNKIFLCVWLSKASCCRCSVESRSRKLGILHKQIS